MSDERLHRWLEAAEQPLAPSPTFAAALRDELRRELGHIPSTSAPVVAIDLGGPRRARRDWWRLLLVAAGRSLAPGPPFLAVPAWSLPDLRRSASTRLDAVSHWLDAVDRREGRQLRLVSRRASLLGATISTMPPVPLPLPPLPRQASLVAVDPTNRAVGLSLRVTDVDEPVTIRRIRWAIGALRAAQTSSDGVAGTHHDRSIRTSPSGADRAGGGR